jgi:3-keto-disaccharide hydrolase
MRTTLAILIVFAGGVTRGLGQTVDTLNFAAVGTDPHWKVVGRSASIVDIKGKHALRLSEGPGMGVVWLDSYDFANGTIEVDILGRSQPVQGSFVGIALRVVDGTTHDAVYFRPFNFRAADSTQHVHAVQYVSHPDWTWQQLRTERPGQYERAIVPEPDGDEWFHVRVDVRRPKIQVFVNNSATPTLVVDELSARTHGPIGLWVGEGSGGYFANLRVQKRTPR